MMMKDKSILIKSWVLGTACVALCACGSGRKFAEAPKAANGEYVYLVADSLLSPEERELKMDYVHYIPDSLLTPGQAEVKREFVKALQSFAKEHVKVEDNKMKFSMSRKEFLKTGLPENIYWQLKREMKTNNRFIKENGVTDVEESWRKIVEED